MRLEHAPGSSARALRLPRVQAPAGGLTGTLAVCAFALPLVTAASVVVR